MASHALDWLKRPIAHRGLDEKGGIENSATAVEMAIAADYAIEVDLRCSRDGLPVVFHDRTLERLTAEEGLGRKTSVKILYFTQLLGMALGLSPRKVGVHENMSDSSDLIRAKGLG